MNDTHIPYLIKQEGLLKRELQMSPRMIQQKTFIKMKEHSPKRAKPTPSNMLFQFLNSRQSMMPRGAENEENFWDIIGDGVDYYKNPQNKGNYIRNKLIRNRLLKSPEPDFE